MTLYDMQMCELVHQSMQKEGPVSPLMERSNGCSARRVRKRNNEEEFIEIVDPSRCESNFDPPKSKDDHFLDLGYQDLPPPKPFFKAAEKSFVPNNNEDCGRLVSALYPNSSKVRAVVSLSSPHTILSVSDSFVRWLGYSRQEVVGRSLKILSGPRTDMFALNAAIKNAAVHNFECIEASVYASSGAGFHVLISCFPFMDAEGVLLGCSLEIKQLGVDPTGEAQLLRIPFPSRISPADAARRRSLNYQTGLALHGEHAAAGAAAAAARAASEVTMLDSLLASVM